MVKRKNKQGHYGHYLDRLKRLYQHKEVKLYTNLILSFLAIGGFAIFAIRPTAVAISQLIKELQNEKEVNQRLTAKIDNLQKAKKNYKQVETDLPLIWEALPKEPEPDLFMAQLEQLAKLNDCVIENVSFSTTNLKGKIEVRSNDKTTKTPQESQPTVNGTLQASGRYQNLTAFLADLYNFRRINETTNISITKTRSGDQLEIKLNFVVYYLPEKE